VKIPLYSGRVLALKPQSFSSFSSMTQMKLASLIGGCLFKSAATSALALYALAGGVVLSGGEAKALNCNFTAGSFTNCMTGQWYETNPIPTDKKIWFFNAPTTGTGDVEWLWVDVNSNGIWDPRVEGPSIDQWHVDVDFNPDLDTLDGLSSLNYAIKIKDGYEHVAFHDVQLVGSVTSGSIVDNVVEKKVWAGSLDANHNPVCSFTGSPLVDQKIPLSPQPWDTAIGGLKVLCVHDTAEVFSGVDLIDN
jgi:hypothetical protein